MLTYGVQHTTPLTTQSLFVIITGAVNAGKSFQLLSILEAEVEGRPVATPTLFLVAESSSEGTIGAILNDPSRACVWPVKDCADADAAIGLCFPRSGPVTLGAAKSLWYARACKVAAEDKVPPPAQPTPSPQDHMQLRSVVVDTLTSTYRGSIDTCKRLYAEAAAAKNKGVPVLTINKKEDPGQNDMNLHAYAARVCGNLIDRLNAVCAHRGSMVFVTVHTCPAHTITQAGPQEPAVKTTIGETPNLGSASAVKPGLTVPSFSNTWNLLSAKANVVVHSFAAVADYSAVDLDNINAPTTPGTVYGLITERGAHYPKLGPVLWVKRQDGAGPWGYLAAMPRYWHPSAKCDPVISAEVSATPSIGAMLAYSIRQYRATLTAST